MPIWKALFLGIVQGLTEFLPVSSSGHLILIQKILHVNLESGGMFFDIMLHLGTLIAIFVAFWHDICKLFMGGISIIYDAGRNVGIFFQNSTGAQKKYHHVIRSSYRKYVMLVIVSTIPTGIIGVLLSSTVEKANDMPIVSAIGLIFTALFLTIADLVPQGDHKPKNISYWDALFVGIVQGLATMPGVSRSGSTISASMLSGFDKKFAVKYSFIMSIPAVLGAVVLEIKDSTHLHVSGGFVSSCILATIVAAISGYLAIRFMLRLVRGKSYRGFAIYCAVVGIAATIWCLL